MRWIVSLSLAAAVAACGGPQIPQHNGYKANNKQPWKKPKVLSLNDKMETKSEGDLSYADMRRAKWFQLELPTNGELSLALEITPPGDGVNDDFDLAMEVLDPGNRVISKADLEESDAHELNKKRTLYELAPGKYLIHVYLQSRTDTADFVLNAAFKPTAAAEVKSDFPAQVEYLPTLPMVSLTDDTPKGYKATPTVVTKVRHTPGPAPKKVEAAPVATVSARIIAVNVVTGGTRITLGRGTGSGAHDGMAGKLGSASFTTEGCTDHSCFATLKMTLDQVKALGGSAVLAGP